MTNISSVSTNNVTVPVTTAEANAKKQAADDRTLKVIEKNSNTAKSCATAAVAASVATLIPLSILAHQTGRMSKIAKELADEAKPILRDTKPLLEGAKPVVDNLKDITGSAKGIVQHVEKTFKEVAETLKSDEWAAVLTELKRKIKDVDSNAITEQLTKSIDDLTQAATGKINEVNPETINELITTVTRQLDDINAKGLSDDASRLINELTEKIKNLRITFEPQA